MRSKKPPTHRLNAGRWTRRRPRFETTVAAETQERIDAAAAALAEKVGGSEGRMRGRVVDAAMAMVDQEEIVTKALEMIEAEKE